MKALHANTYDLVINAGIAGGFPDRAEVGSLVIAEEIVCADLGAESPEGFLSLDELGFGSSTRIPAESAWCSHCLLPWQMRICLYILLQFSRFLR